MVGGSELRVQDFWFRVEGFECLVHGFRFTLGFRIWVQGRFAGSLCC